MATSRCNLSEPEPPGSIRRPSFKRRPHRRTKPALRALPAELSHAKAIHELIESYTPDGTLLRRSYSEICQNIHSFTVVENQAGQFIGCASLHIYGSHLAEIRSIVVLPGAAGRGAGSLLVQSLLQRAEHSSIKCVCLFTRIPGFFERFHFRLAEHHLLRDKVKKDCQYCSKRNACDEIAMVIGEVPVPNDSPSMQSIRAPQHRGLAQTATLVQLQL